MGQMGGSREPSFWGLLASIGLMGLGGAMLAAGLVSFLRDLANLMER